MQEAEDRNALPAQMMIGGGAQESPAKTINQNADSNPSAMGSCQRADELHSDVVGAEDVGGKPDVKSGALDGGEHLWVSLIAAFEHCDHLSRCHVLAGDLRDGGL